MQKYDAQHSNMQDSSMDEDGGLPPELTEETDATFVTETPKGGRSTAMLLAGVLLLGGGAIFIMRTKAGPTPAAASAESTTAKATINEFLSDGGKNIKAMRDLLKDTEKLVQQFLDYPSIVEASLESLKSNPFLFASKSNVAEDPDRLSREREKQKQEVLKAVQQLRLQSIIHSGRVRTCMVNNSAYEEGQEIDGFLVERIGPDSVVVSRSGYRFELRMQR